MEINVKSTWKVCRKNFNFLFHVANVFFWCWWARGVYENVSRVLQTPKTTKFGSVFLIIHYNRHFNTNGHLMLSVSPASFWAASEERRKNDLLRKLLGFRSSASDMSLTNARTSLREFLRSVASHGAAQSTRAAVYVFAWFCHKPWHASVNPII